MFIPILMMLVACDSRKNPAARLVGRAASDFGHALGDLCTSIGNLCESPSTPSLSPTSSYTSFATHKPTLAVTSSGRIVEV